MYMKRMKTPVEASCGRRPAKTWLAKGNDDPAGAGSTGAMKKFASAAG
jgi:hypothetical protein